MNIKLINNIKLIQGDCNNVMKELINDGVKVNKIITSPPYNIVRPNSTDRGYDLYKDGMSNEEYIEWTIKNFERFDEILEKDGCIIYNMSYGAENTTCMSLTIAEILKRTNFTLADIVVWKKKTASPNNVSHNKLTRICEFIYIFVRNEEFKSFKTNKKVVSVRTTGQKCYENKFNFIEAKNNDKSNNLNKATYSTDLMHKIFDFYVLDNDIILDPFGGTGTTAAASFERGNECYSIELSEKQVDYSYERILDLSKPKKKN